MNYKEDISYRAEPAALYTIVRKYAVYIGITFKQNLVYRGSIWLIYLGIMLRLTIYYYLWTVLASSRPDLNRSQLITYSLLALIISRAVDSSISIQMGSSLKDGSIITHFLRPINIQFAMFFQSFGEGVYNLIIYGPLSYFGAFFLFPIQLPPSPSNFLLFFVSLVAGMFIGAAINFIFGVLSFWTYNSWGLTVFKQLLFTLLSGILIPLPLMPDKIRQILSFLPFQYMVNRPVLIFLGEITVRQAVNGILIQLAWAAGLLVIGYLISKKAFSLLTVQGG